MAKIRMYRNSFMASLVSLCGYGLAFLGIVVAFSESVVGGIIVALAGVGLMCWAPKISENKQFRVWKRKLESVGITSRMKEDVDVAVMVYNSNPGKKL